MTIRTEIQQGYVLLCQLAVALLHHRSNRFFRSPNGPVSAFRTRPRLFWGGIPVLWGLVLVLSGCQSVSPLGSNQQQPYQWDNLTHHPSFVWHRFSPDSAAVFVRLPAHEPLHLRENRDQPFGFALQLDLAIQPLDDAPADSVTPFLGPRGSCFPGAIFPEGFPGNGGAWPPEWPPRIED